MLELLFLIFWIFLKFFLEVSCSGWVRTEFGTKNFFSLFLRLSHPVLAKTNAGKRFFNFLNFSAFFFRIFFPRPSMNGSRGKIFFLSFLAYLLPFWLKIIPERDFFNFLIFFFIVLKFSCPGLVWAEFGTKIFFTLSPPISSRFG